ncbi:pectinesterase family protein [Pedobacter puniceum]|uniref:Pectinesterase n=1 Tax=Pedobacter puniceum TaxID=2666136 RepID=A0A7K0FM45_9SPHI|nr:pectinesterase family protein [Pedobacter puniceum]MRX47039.1 pectin esterase [Pedobacter puniceum]
MKHILGFLFCFLSIIVSQAQPKVYPSKFTVAQDGSGDFKTIQEAINAVRDHSEEKVTITIKPGIYKEKLVIPTWKRNIILQGENKENTIISHADYSGKIFSGTDITGNPKFSTYTSYTVLIAGNDCELQNLTIENTAGAVGQAVALHIEGDRTAVKNCDIKGHQDTLYVAKDGARNYFENCTISGTTDFIFGAATAWFQSCNIISIKDSYITAASTTSHSRYGFVFMNCKLLFADDKVTKVFLGRPWRPHAKTVFISTFMDKHIKPEGWDNWRDPKNESTVFYAEYGSSGLGAFVRERVKWAHQLKQKELRAYTLSKVFNGWQPFK